MADKKWILLFAAWFVAGVATLGSLVFSNVMNLPPCSLCWYQRIFMYPLVLVLLAGLVPFTPAVLRFAAPLAAAGWLTAFYHNLLYYRILPESAAPCRQGVSCTSVQIEWLGFITIPLLSLVGFSLILLLLFRLKKEIFRES
jgi:disulfide bond formation protein DsbB